MSWNTQQTNNIIQTTKPNPRAADSKVHISTHLQHASVEMCVRALGAAFPVSLGPLFYNSANMGYRFPVRCVSHTNTCLHHLPQITPSYFSHPWEKKKKKIQAISSGSQRKQFGSGRLLGLKKRARAPTRRVHFASIIIWARTNGWLFRNPPFKGRVFSPDKPEGLSCARPQANSLHVQNSFLRSEPLAQLRSGAALARG